MKIGKYDPDRKQPIVKDDPEDEAMAPIYDGRGVVVYYNKAVILGQEYPLDLLE